MRGLAGYDTPFSFAAMGVAFDPGSILAALSVAGSLLSAGGSVISGNAQARQADYEAQQLRGKATEERAAASHDAAERQKRQDLVLSRQQALSAASGGSATDPSILDLMGDTSRQGYVDRQVTIGTGENRARGYEDSAAMSHFNGQQARRAGQIGAISTLISAPAGAFKAYGLGVMPFAGTAATPGGTPASNDPLKLPTYWDSWLQ